MDAGTLHAELLSTGNLRKLVDGLRARYAQYSSTLPDPRMPLQLSGQNTARTLSHPEVQPAAIKFSACQSRAAPRRPKVLFSNTGHRQQARAASVAKQATSRGFKENKVLIKQASLEGIDGLNADNVVGVWRAICSIPPVRPHVPGKDMTEEDPVPVPEMAEGPPDTKIDNRYHFACAMPGQVQQEMSDEDEADSAGASDVSIQEHHWPGPMYAYETGMAINEADADEQEYEYPPHLEQGILSILT